VRNSDAPKGSCRRNVSALFIYFRIYRRSLPPTPAGMTRPYPLPVTSVSLRILRTAVIADRAPADWRKRAADVSPPQARQLSTGTMRVSGCLRALLPMRGG
jgi:hypothetical protein